MFRKTGGGFAFVALLLAGCLLVISTTDVQLGIDLRGGTELTYTVDINKVDAARRSTALDEVKQILSNRFDQYGIKELSITPRGNRSLVIQIPSADNKEIERIKSGIEEAGRLTIHLVSAEEYQQNLAEIEIAAEQYAREWRENEDKKAAGEPGKEMDEFPARIVVQDGTSGGKLVVESAPATYVDGKNLSDAFSTVDKFSMPAVGFKFNAVGGAAFGELTGPSVGQRLAMVLDGVTKSVATIQSRISTEGQLTGNFTQEEVNDIVTLLRSGSLPVAPEYESENRVGSLLGQESIKRGTQAMVIGLVLVLAFLMFYYRLVLGGIAALTLGFNLTLVYTLLVLFQNSLTLPGFAGLLLTVGMAVDANILIYERIREERQRGRGLSQSISSGFSRAFSTILDANLTTLITAWILFVNGTGPIKGFAVVLSVGIICTFFSSLFFSRLLISFLVMRGTLTDVKMKKLIDDPKIDFLAYRKMAKTASIVLIVIGLGCLIARNKESLGIDFTGGTRLVANLQEPRSEKEIRDLVSQLGTGSQYTDVQVQALDPIGQKATAFSVRTRTVQTKESADSTEVAKLSAANAFKAKVEEALRGMGWLAPESLENESTSDTNVYSADLNLRAAGGLPLTADSVKGLLTAAEYPVDTVAAKGSGVGVWSTFTVVSTPQPTAGVLHDQLMKVFRDTSNNGENKIQLAEPFAEVNTIGSRVAQDMQSKVFIAMILAFAAIIFYISLRFHFTFGLAAIVALVHDIFFTLGALAVGDLLFGSFLNLKINLPVVAGLLTVVGYSLNDTIVIFDRIRENVAGKKRNIDYEKVVNSSINDTLSRTVLTSVTTFLVVTILLIWGGEALHGFAFALCVGVVVGTYSSIYVASPALIFFQQKAEARRELVLQEAAAAGEL